MAWSKWHEGWYVTEFVRQNTTSAYYIQQETIDIAMEIFTISKFQVVHTVIIM